MGVSGSGKSTIGQMLSKATGLPYFDADDFHSVKNIEKMRAGKPLNDRDRHQWLLDLSIKLKDLASQEGGILACSALKEQYRKTLVQYISQYKLVFLSGDFDLIYNRLNKRKGHYMKENMLRSQFDILEIPEQALKVNIAMPCDRIVQQIRSYL